MTPDETRHPPALPPRTAGRPDPRGRGEITTPVVCGPARNPGRRGQLGRPAPAIITARAGGDGPRSLKIPANPQRTTFFLSPLTPANRRPSPPFD